MDSEAYKHGEKSNDGKRDTSKRTIVYGLGEIYQKNKDRIHSLYHVVGYCDRNRNCIPDVRGITREQLASGEIPYDILLISASPVRIILDLIENLNIPEQKIHVLFYDDVARLSHRELCFYGASNEDAAILFLMKFLGFDFTNLRYLEIGTNDPVYRNNSFNLYRLGARGMLVDPLPGVLPLVHMIRPEYQFLEVAVSNRPHSGKTMFYVSENDPLSSLYVDHHREFSQEKSHAIHEISVNVMDVNELLGSMDFIPDIILIDAEGEDENILRGIDYQKYKPTVIVAEVYRVDDVSLENFMRAQGYDVFARFSDSNVIFVLGSSIEVCE